jgi:hypothetical protein
MSYGTDKLINKSDALLMINCFIHMEQAFGPPNPNVYPKLLFWKRKLQRWIREEKAATNKQNK